MTLNKLDKKVEHWKSQLLDFSKRNRLINFKKTKTTIKLETETNEIFDLLIEEENKIMVKKYVQTELEAKRLTKQSIGSIEDLSEEKYEQVYQQNLKIVVKKLENQLNGVRLKGKSSIEEKGINTLYLAIGFLEWKEVEYSGDFIKSPILLLPVKLKRQSGKDPYFLERIDEDIILNPVLEQKLKLDFGVTVTPFEQLNYESIEDILNFYQEELRIEDSWKIINEIYIGLFSFSKLVMFKDFDNYEEHIKSNPFIQKLAGEESEEDVCRRDNIKDISIYDRNLGSEDSYQVLDADSSQQEAILAAKNNVSFVLQGPPGTGKSQTITNIIAELLSQEKRVLFVSEKKAALDVVKKRLDDVKLGDFSLDLHSHDSNKKYVLEELSRSLKVTTSPFSFFQYYSDLDDVKESLNTYVDALHMKVKPLNEKPQTIHGELSKLNEVPNLIFDISNVDLFSSDKLRKVLKQVNRLEDIRDDIASTDTHLWKGTIKIETGFELEAEISSNFVQLSNDLKELHLSLKRASKNIGYDGSLSLNGIDHILDLKKTIANKPVVPSIWLGEDGSEVLTKAKNNYKDYKELYEGYLRLKKEILQKYKEDIFNLDINKVNYVMNEKHRKELSGKVSKYDLFIDELLSQETPILNTLDSLNENLNNISERKRELELLTLNPLNKLTIDEIFFHKELYEYIQGNPRPTHDWFVRDKKEEIRESIQKNKQLQDNYLSQKEELMPTFEIEIIEEDLQGILDNFINNYSSIFKIFNKNYRKDKRLIYSYLTMKGKLNDTNVVKYLRKLIKLKSLKTEINNNETYLNDLFGSNYEGVETNWDTLSEKVDTIFALGTYLQRKGKENYQKFVIEMDLTNLNTYRDLLWNLQESCDQVNKEFNFLEKTLQLENFGLENDSDILNSRADLSWIQEVARDIFSIKDILKGVSLTENDFTLNKLNNVVKIITEFKNVEGKVQDSSSFLKEIYGVLYNGVETNWQSINLALNWTDQANNNFEGWFPAEFVETVNNPESYTIFKQECDKLEQYINKVDRLLNFYGSIFSSSESKFDGENLYQADLLKAAKKLELLADNTSTLQEWITINEIISDLEQEGLRGFVTKVKVIDKNHTVESLFLKRFYQMWLDRVYSDLSPLKGFRIDQHNNLLEEFKDLDKGIIAENSARTHELLRINKDYYINNFAHKSSEMGFLKREIQKKKRHKPIRELFANITNLLLAIKPCMMMSPLSVSQFIDPGKLQFDAVIFDEASQIRPEDAVGTIMRGKQVIITGDNKQLPPTSFFNSQIEVDEEFIDEEDEDVYESFESILDESLLFMPQLSLKWHYRSKQESLIAFSNREIYNNELYTFPNAIQGENDGVSFVHVEDGVYDRGKSNRNLKEAEVVANLVFNHFKHKPHRSLGIIAFSQTQQEAIRDKLYQLRDDMPEFERFFDESKFESFFIKNLENVQGDERDTIILSVGYGKDSNGTIYYNFGPLNKEGGHRRLNVAVSRAKMELITVSSILDIDLDDTKLNKRGPQLLKAYLSYSKNGGEFSHNTGIQNNGFFDSPFEEDVYKTLEEKGLHLHTQVGSSGYRIDLAVVDPDYPGKYLLGIECDGATYHSSKTARDRDRLRQSVLESLGWKIERIWSQDWVKRKNDIANSIVEKVIGIKANGVQ